MDAEKKKKVQSTIDAVQKSFGTESITRLGSTSKLVIETFPSGSLALDYALGGGVPKGRIIEIYGPESSGKTTVTLHMIAEVQKSGGACAFIDAEHALDPEYAANIGVDIEDLYISQPDCGEQAMNIVDAIVSNGGFDLIVVDSVAALTPKAELDGEIGDAHVGLHARLMSQSLRILTSKVSKSNCTIVFINQIREKVGVMYGCLHADTIVPFADGRSFPIREIVENQIQGEVWAYDEKEEKFVKKPIIDWHYNGDVVNNEDYIHIETNAFDTKGGICGITVTPDHRIMTKDGWKKAKDVTIQDYILSKYISIVNNTLEDFLYGMFVGDSTIAIRAKNTAAIKIQDNVNKEYAEWKVSKLSPFFKFTSRMSNQFVRHESNFSTELAIIKKTLGERNPLALLRFHFSRMGLAIWYMDDGSYDCTGGHNRSSISIKRISKDENMMVAVQKAFKDIGLECTYDKKDATFCFNTENTQKLFDMIAEYVPDCMQYKLDEKHRGMYKDFNLSSESVYKEGYLPIKSIRIASDKQMKQKGKYDITIKDCHNYIAGGIQNGLLVHNSPETTTGGRALKFYASQRLDVRKTETLKKDGEASANHVKVKVVKNKIAPPFKTAEFDIEFGVGISRKSEVSQLAVELGLIEKKGGWFYYKDIKMHGIEEVKTYIETNQDVMDELVANIRSILTDGVILNAEDPIELEEVH